MTKFITWKRDTDWILSTLRTLRIELKSDAEAERQHVSPYWISENISPPRKFREVYKCFHKEIFVTWLIEILPISLHLWDLDLYLGITLFAVVRRLLVYLTSLVETTDVPWSRHPLNYFQWQLHKNFLSSKFLNVSKLIILTVPRSPTCVSQPTDATR
jgi:hypothetical protein